MWRIRLVVAAWSLGLAAAPLRAQAPERLASLFNPANASNTTSSSAQISRTQGQQVVVVHRKQPILAGVLSAFFPGGGSFYAGHSKHGWTHLGVFVLSGLMVWAASGDCHSCYVNAGLAVSGLLAFGVNGYWSTFSGVGDANAYNRDAKDRALNPSR